MCWRSSKLVTKNSGDEKIPIYKVLELAYGVLKAYYHPDFCYALHSTYKHRVSPERYSPNLYLIQEGLHCYSDKCKFRYIYHGVLVTCLTETQKYPSSSYTTAVIVKGYIPPNTTYYINEEEEIVTEGLVLTEIITDYVLDI